MEIKDYKKTGNTVEMEIVVAKEDHEKNLNRTYQELSKEVKIPGFRPGKAPLNILKQHLNPEAVIERAIRYTISEVYPEVIKEKELEPLDYPKIDLSKLEEGQDLVFKLAVEVFPEIKLPEYKGIKVKSQSSEVTDKEVEDTLAQIRKEHPQLEGDLPEEEFKKNIRENMELQKKEAAEATLKNEILEKVTEKSRLEIPEILIQREVDTSTENLKRNLKQRQLDFNEYLKTTNRDEEKLAAEFREAAVKKVKNRLVLEAIAKKESITISDIDLEVEMKTLAQETGSDLASFKKSIGEGVTDYIKEYLLRRKALNFLVLNAKISN